ncbi:methyltransferase domain-containing protein [bacterium]|nr:methyltransferase domain-containing protein [bacterium]
MRAENSSNHNPLADYFDRCADEGVFEKFSPEELPIAKDLLREMNIQAGQKIIEPGCGEGRLTGLLAEMVGPQGKVFAFDISPRMVEKCLTRNLPPQAEIARTCATNLPLPDGEFHAVVCLNTFPHLEDRPAALGEFRRVLCREGILWIAHTRSREWVNSLHSSIGGVLTGHLLPTDAEFDNLLRQTGFSLEFLRDLPDRYLLKAVL